jgi:hydrogenase/urease accessory protein HupE
VAGEAARAVLERAIVQRVQVADRSGERCPGRLLKLETTDSGAVVLDAVYRCAAALDRERVQLELWDELTPGHRHLASVASPDASAVAGSEQLLYRERPRLELGAVPEPKTLSLLDWILLGVEHIVGGTDHLLFLLALVLVTPAMRSLALTVSVFTLAHSVTLALSTLQIILPPPGLVECAIALSICYVGLENLTERASRPRHAIVFAFGLIHGFGFAGALAELGLPQAQAPSALFSFNLGVELGQLAVLALAFPIIQQLRRTHWFVPRGIPALSLCTALAGMVWFIDRV